MDAIERARHKSAEMSLVLEGSKINDKPVELPNAALVEEMCDYLLHQKHRELKQVAPEHRAGLVPQFNISDGGFRRLAVTKDDFERLLAPWKRALGDLMLAVPRNEGESLADYRLRLTQSGENWWNRLYGMANMLAHIHRIEEEERAARQLELAAEEERQREEKERRQAARRELERQATVDPKEIKRLIAVIAEAKDIEALLALRDKANAARMALRDIYATEREACAYLGRPVPAREVPGWPNAFEAVQHSVYADVPKRAPAAPALRKG